MARIKLTTDSLQFSLFQCIYLWENLSWFLCHAATSAPPALSSFGIFLDLGARFSAFTFQRCDFLQNSNEKIGKLYKIEKHVGLLCTKTPPDS